jgi:hypothetical protein
MFLAAKSCGPNGAVHLLSGKKLTDYTGPSEPVLRARGAPQGIDRQRQLNAALDLDKNDALAVEPTVEPAMAAPLIGMPAVAAPGTYRH